MEVQEFRVQSCSIFGLLFTYLFTLSQGLDGYISKPYFDKNEILDDSKFARFLNSEISVEMGSCQMVELPRLIALNRNLIGEGSHRRLISSLRLESTALIGHSCEIIVIERLPSGVFADPFELQHLIQQGVLNDAAVFGDTNLELPSFRSNRSLVEIHMEISPSMFSQDQLKIIVGLPLHARYQPLGHGYSRVVFSLPDIFLRCKIEGYLHKQSCLLLPTDQSAKSEDAAIAWEVPCGNKEHAEIVSIVTFVSAVLSALLIVWTSVANRNVAFPVDLKQS